MGWVVLGVECMLMCMGGELCCGWLRCSCYAEMAGMVCLELVLQAGPFLHSADRFQYAAHRGKKFDVWIYNFTSKHL